LSELTEMIVQEPEDSVASRMLSSGVKQKEEKVPESKMPTREPEENTMYTNKPERRFPNKANSGLIFTKAGTKGAEIAKMLRAVDGETAEKQKKEV